MIKHNQTVCPDFPNVVAQHHILGSVHRRGLWPPNSNSADIFVQCTYPPSFIVLCLLVLKLSCWQTKKYTNSRRWKHPTLFAMLRCCVITSKIHEIKQQLKVCRRAAQYQFLTIFRICMTFWYFQLNIQNWPFPLTNTWSTCVGQHCTTKLPQRLRLQHQTLHWHARHYHWLQPLLTTVHRV